MEDPSDRLDNGKLDLVPMIDCIMLLLLFFILTTKFTDEEKGLAAILSDKGQAGHPIAELKPPITIVAYPAGMQRGLQPSAYAAAWAEVSANGGIPARVELRVGHSDPLLIDGEALAAKGPATAVLMKTINDYISGELERYELADVARKDLPEVDVHCFSGLPWKYAAVVYDAVRGFEYAKRGVTSQVDIAELLAERAISFAPPRVRDSSHELGNELFEIVNLR